MKRLVWLVLAIFCTAFAQVQTVEPLLPAANPSECCGGCNAVCGMPDCALPPAPASPVTAPQPGTAASVAKPTGKVATVRRGADKFFAGFADPADRLIAFRAPASLAPAASVPLFKEHCSFLL